MRHRLQITIAALLLAMLLESISSVCRASDPADPAEALRDSVSRIADAVLVDLGAGKTSVSKELAPRLIETLLNAGRCDEAYKHMMIVPGESFQLYCRVMAEIGRGDEVPGKAQNFQSAFPVKRLMADEEVSFEHLYTIPMHHGKALRYVSQGMLDSAMEELQTLNEMKRFGGEFDSIAESVIIAIHRKAGAKHCLTAIEKYSGDQPEKLKNVTRGVVMKLPIKDQLDILKLLPEKHSRTYLWEMALIISDDQIDETDKKLAIDDALVKMDHFGIKDAIALKSYLLKSDLVSAEKKSVFADECVEWITKNRNHIASNQPVFKWFLSQSKWEQIESIVSSSRDSEQHIIVIGQLVRMMGKGSSPDSVDRVVDWFPDAAEASRVKYVDESIPDFLIEAGKLTLAEDWLPKVRDRDHQQALSQKLDLYRVLETSKFADTKAISAKLAAIDKELSPSTKLTFQRSLGVDYLAEIAVRAGAKTALAVARNLPVDANGSSNAIGKCTAALLNRGDTALALEVVEQGTTKEIQSARLSDVNFDRIKPEDRHALKLKLASFFPGDPQFNAELIRGALSRGDKAEALDLVEEYFRRWGAVPLWLSCRFAEQGWHDEFAVLASRIETQEGRKNSTLKGTTNECVADAAWELLNKSDYTGSAVVTFVKKHIRTPKDRIQIFLDLTSEFSLSR